MKFIWIFAFSVALLSLLKEVRSEDAIFKLLQSKYKSSNSPSRIGSNSEDSLILTKFIEEGKLKEAREAARVDSEQFITGIDSYAGYFTVNKEFNANLFFWYFPVLNRQIEATPWLIWLQGGPAVSSLYGLFSEIGPYAVNNKTLISRKYTWAHNHSLLFIDNPVGTGFSFTEDSRGYATNQTTVGEDLYIALQQFLTIFPELRKAPLTITGESYAGKHIPSLGIQIHWNREKDPPINLKGLAIGNGFIDPVTLLRHSYFIRETGLLDDNEADMVKMFEEKTMNSLKLGDMAAAYLHHSAAMRIMHAFDGVDPYNYLKEAKGNMDGDFEEFLNRNEIRKALHVGNNVFTSLNEVVYNNLVFDFMNTAKPWLEELIQNYKVLCYNGQLDTVVPYHVSVNTHNSLKFPGSEKMNSTMRFKWYHERRLAGYYKTVGNFTEVMVRGAGHMVPTDQPSAALGMISAFVRNASLAKDTGHFVEN